MQTAPAPAPASGSCPKRMVYGPCGGVRPDLGCEMVEMRCTFTRTPDAPPLAWPGPVRTAAPVSPPLVLTDLSGPPGDATTLTAIARILAPSADALLVGDHQDRPDFQPSVLARLIADAGSRPFVTLACRDRNRSALEQELRALQRDGLATALCVTGDGRAFDVRPDVAQAFDLDGTRLAALAAAIGVPTAVAETPCAPPAGLRPARLVAKQHAGAAVAVLNHVRSAAEVDAFLVAARALGLTIPVVAAVAVYTDARSAAALSALPGLEIDPAEVGAVLQDRDPVAAGIHQAVREARRLLAVPGVAGVNLSGMASTLGPHAAAEIQAEIGRRIREDPT